MDTNGNISKLFVSYELALLAKEKGFDEDCFYYYQNETKEFCFPWNISKFEWFTKVPLYQQLVDWFKENHRILVSELWDGWKVCQEDGGLIFCEDKDEALLTAFGLI